MDYIQIDVRLKGFNFSYTRGLFKKKTITKYLEKNSLYTYYWGYYRATIEADTEKVNNKIADFKELFRKEIIEDEKLKRRYKNFELEKIDYDVSQIQASKMPVDWCMQNLTAEQFFNMGLSIL